MNNNGKYNITEAISLLDYYLLMTTNSNKQSFIVSKNANNNIVIFNNNFKANLTKKEFLNNFSEELFTIFKSINEDIEINTEFKKLRQ